MGIVFNTEVVRVFGFWLHGLKLLQPRGTVPYGTFFLVRLGAIVLILLLWQEVVSQIAERPGTLGIGWFMSYLW